MIRAPAFAGLGLVLLGAGATDARTWHLAPDGSGDTATIQEAIDLAAPGDVIQLDCGTFHESGLQMRAGLGLRGVAQECTTIEADDAGTLMTCNTVHDASIEEIHFHGAAVLLEISGSNLELRRCTFDGGGAYGPPWRRGIRCVSTALVLDTCRLSAFITWEQYGSAGPALFCNLSSVTITGSVFESNRADGGTWWSSGRGGGVYAMSSSVVIDGCEFLGNVAGAVFSDGGGVSCQGCTPVRISNSTFENNRTGNGGAVSVGGCGQVEIRGCLFRGNHAEGYGGGVWMEECGPRLESCVLTENDAYGGGAVAGFLVEAAAPAIVQCTVQGNTATEGAGIRVMNSGTLRLENSIVAFGRAGAAASSETGAEVQAVCSDVFGNEGGDWVGPLDGQLGAGNLCTWPLFCWAEEGDFHLGSTSPCLPEHNACHVQMGALGLGCGPISVTRTSWGRIKGMYR